MEKILAYRLLPFPDSQIHTYGFELKQSTFCYLELRPATYDGRLLPDSFFVRIFITEDVEFQGRGICVESADLLQTKALPSDIVTRLEATLQSIEPSEFPKQWVWFHLANIIARTAKLEISPPSGGQMYFHLTFNNSSLNGSCDAVELRKFIWFKSSKLFKRAVGHR